jgi:uncharacterized protein (TIGR02466 family)
VYPSNSWRYQCGFGPGRTDGYDFIIAAPLHIPRTWLRMDNEPQLDWLFAVPLFQQKLPEFAAHQTELVTFLRDLRDRDPGVQRSNVGGWHSNDLLRHADTPVVGWLLAQIREFATRSLEQVGARKRKVEVTFDAAWSIINRAGDWNTPHNHMPSQWSGVCYLQIDESSTARHDGNIVFTDPLPLGPRYRTPINVFMKPRNGAIFLFPSYLVHMVEPYRGDGERIIVSFNLQFTST